MDSDANVLGALALVVTDLMSNEIAAVAGQSASAAAALSALDQFLDHPTLDQLRRVLGLTPSGAVRLVDRLAAAGLVARGPGGDGRSRSVTLTDDGRRAAQRVERARAGVLSGLVADLTPGERDQLRALMARLMTAVVARKEGGAWVCRLCDLDACGRGDGRCPTATAAAAKYGTNPVA